MNSKGVKVPACGPATMTVEVGYLAELLKLATSMGKVTLEREVVAEARPALRLVKLVAKSANRDRRPTAIDIGANTARFALRCCAHDPDVQLTLVDLPQQLAVAMANVRAAGVEGRVTAHPADLLDPGQPLPQDGDVYWMSQFLDCFAPDQVVSILRRVCAAMPAHATLCIVELFPDRQRFESAAYSLNATSLYFTCLANGNSRFYRCEDFLGLVHDSGLRMVEQVDGVGLGHSLLQLRRN